MTHKMPSCPAWLPGFSLTELLIAMVILSVLVLLALPRLFPLVTRAKTKEAEIALSTIRSLQDVYRMEHDRYAGETDVLGFRVDPLVTEGGTARYRIAIETEGNRYVARATAVVDFDNDGVFNVWEATEKDPAHEVVPD